MSLILSIETATETCSVALSQNSNLIECIEVTEPKVHATLLHRFIKDILNKSKIDFNQVDAVAVSKGPGSYTGLRIGVATAKGICFALNKPLISVSTLFAFTQYHFGSQMNSNNHATDLFVPMFDARRDEVYTATFDSNFTTLITDRALILDETSFKKELDLSTIHFFGSGAEKASKIITPSPKALFYLDKNPSAKGMIQSATEKFINKDFESVAYFEPYYLKEFVSASLAKQL